MPQLQRPPSCGLTRSLTYLLLLVSLTIHTIRCQPEQVSSASGYTCTPECGPGYECTLGQCTRKQCTRDCSGVPKQQLCGSDGETYDNMCQVEKAKCELARDITKEYDGMCITLPPPPAQLCRTQQRQFDFGTIQEYFAKCNYNTAIEKNRSGTLEQSDIDNCYRPQCDYIGNYLAKQCSYHFRDWCWCSSPDGYAIPGTFQRNMPYGYCSNRQTCEVGGETKMDGQIYTPAGVCGLCECLNGTHTCFVNHTIDANNRLSNDSLENLKKQLIQIFNFQYNHKDHIKFDIRYIYKYPTEVSNSQKETILGWKFNYYDRNDDDVLNRVEEFIFHEELTGFLGCSKFFKHLNELTDKNNDKEISLQEWNDLFELNTSGLSVQPVKREAASTLIRRPLHRRKKFLYTLN